MRVKPFPCMLIWSCLPWMESLERLYHSFQRSAPKKSSIPRREWDRTIQLGKVYPSSLAFPYPKDNAVDVFFCFFTLAGEITILHYSVQRCRSLLVQTVLRHAWNYVLTIFWNFFNWVARAGHSAGGRLLERPFAVICHSFSSLDHRSASSYGYVYSLLFVLSLSLRAVIGTNAQKGLMLGESFDLDGGNFVYSEGQTQWTTHSGDSPNKLCLRWAVLM